MDVVPLLVSAALAALIAPGALRAFAEAGQVRENFRAARLPFPAGAVAVCAGVLALGVLASAERVFDDEILIGTEWLPLWLGVAFIGCLDDVLDLPGRGLRSHARTLAGGGFSTGAMKALGTAALAFFVVSRGDTGFGKVALSTLVIALATNLFNLLDLRPGRAVKAWVLLAGGLLIGEWDAEGLRLVGVLAGALLVLGAYDLRERCMLGDTGANLLGALAGSWLVVALGTPGEAVAAAVLVALTIFGEFRSFTRTIERVPPLRVLDSLGRRTDA
jgi:UDP-GlcNAc:undecaprenyl-phosphate GlcNAc-1-phosphate transferase